MKQNFIVCSVYLIGNYFFFIFFSSINFLTLKFKYESILVFEDYIKMNSFVTLYSFFIKIKKSKIILLTRHFWLANSNKDEVECLLSIPFFLTIGHVDIIRTKSKLSYNNLCGTKIPTMTLGV